jgi:hypothetical protein
MSFSMVVLLDWFDFPQRVIGAPQLCDAFSRNHAMEK